MKLKRVLAYAGKTSQTGIATSDRFPGLCIEGGKESFEELLEIVTKEPSLSALPLWNSHLGEIKRKIALLLLDMAFANKVKIQEFWPARIKFELVAKKGTGLKKVKNILIVFAAKSQCSNFLKKFKFEERISTVDAYEDFLKDTRFDAVLCAPDQWDKDKCVKLKDDVSNFYNFTTFILLGNIDIEKCKGTKCEPLRKYATPKRFNITGVDMPLLVPTLTDEQQTFLDDLTKDANSIDDIPRIIFIFKREAGRCGILMESTLDIFSSYHQEDGYLPDIIVRPDLGKSNKQYTEMTINLIKNEFPKFFSYDFIKHIGTQTCLYACRELNILVHGFDHDVVEAVVRRIINKYFELIDNGLPCSASQKNFFNKYKRKYYDSGAQFIDFMQV